MQHNEQRSTSTVMPRSYSHTLRKGQKRRLNIAPRWNMRKHNGKAEKKQNSMTPFSVEHIEARLSEHQHVQVDLLIQLSPSFGSDWQPGSMIQVINGDSEVVV